MRGYFMVLPLVVQLVVFHMVFKMSAVDSDGYEFHIVSLDNKQWYFEAQSFDVSISESDDCILDTNRCIDKRVDVMIIYDDVSTVCVQEREDWVQAIEQQIMSRLQGLESSKSKVSWCGRSTCFTD